MRMVNISNEKSMQSYTARCSRYKNKYTNLVCGKTAVGRNYNLPRDISPKEETLPEGTEAFLYWDLPDAVVLPSMSNIVYQAVDNPAF